MLALGDLRNRLLALVDDVEDGGARIAQVLSYRLPKQAGPVELQTKLRELATGSSGCLHDLPELLRDYARSSLVDFMEHMPSHFDLRGASIGNLILASRYLQSGRDIGKTIAEFSSLTNVRGVVLPVVDANLTLVAQLQDGSRVVGQHRITATDLGPLPSRIEDLYLVEDAAEPAHRGAVDAAAGLCQLVQEADLICFPMGSFFTSVIANLLPRGIGRAISAADCRKVYVPNAGDDPEEMGYSLDQRLDVLQRMVARDCDGPLPGRRAVNTVLIDSRNVHYSGGCDIEVLRKRGVDVLDVPLASQVASEHLDPHLLAPVLCALARRPRG
jgi:CofD-related protein of GAK system